MVEAKGKRWYWEHCGMLNNEHYRSRWESKKKLYELNGYGQYSETNPTGRLIITEDSLDGGLDTEISRKLNP